MDLSNDPGSSPPLRRRGAKQRIAISVGTALGVGLVPFAPGTLGSLVPGLPLAWLLGGLGIWAILAGALVLFLAGWWAAGACEEIYGRRDPPCVVIDEVLGMLVAVAGLDPDWRALLLGFIFFRIADIWKPWPCRLVDRKVKGGLGIVLDDVLAGVYARGALEIAIRCVL